MDTAIQQHLENWLEGDDASFQPVFRHYYQRLLSFAVRFLRDRPLAEEITMDVLLKVWQNRQAVTNHATFQSYLFVILRNQLVSVSRKKQPLLVPIGDAEHELPDDDPDSVQSVREVLQHYHNCLSRLSPKRRQVFLLSREHGLTHAEIAHQLGLSVFTVKNHIKAALQLLKSELPQAGVVLLYGTFLLDNLH